MPIVTLTSDLGKDLHQVARVKMRLQAAQPQVQVIDIAHTITPFAIEEAYYLVSTSMGDFPPGTLHLVAVDADMYKYKRLLACQYNQQWFLGVDNGFFSMLVGNREAVFYEIPVPPEDTINPFPLKNVLVPAALKILAEGAEKAGTPATGMLEKVLEVPWVAENHLRGQVVYVNNFCNAITNINREQFEAGRKDRYFEIVLNRFDRITQISDTYSQVPEGECLCFFNEEGFLEIAVNRGKASQLLGLEKGKRITIEFHKESLKSRPKPGGLL